VTFPRCCLQFRDVHSCLFSAHVITTTTDCNWPRPSPVLLCGSVSWLLYRLQPSVCLHYIYYNVLQRTSNCLFCGFVITLLSSHKIYWNPFLMRCRFFTVTVQRIAYLLQVRMQLPKRISKESGMIYCYRGSCCFGHLAVGPFLLVRCNNYCNRILILYSPQQCTTLCCVAYFMVSTLDSVCPRILAASRLQELSVYGV